MIVFISYSNADEERVQGLAVDLGRLGHDVQLEQKIPGGEVGWYQVFESIHACDLFVYAMTERSSQSLSNKLEYDYAASLKKRILFAVFEDVHWNTLPFDLIWPAFVDYRTMEDNTAQLEEVIESLPSEQPLPNPPPYAPVLTTPLNTLSAQVMALDENEYVQQVLAQNLGEFLERYETFETAHRLLKSLRNQPQLTPYVRYEIDQTFRYMNSQRTRRTMSRRVRRVIRDGVLLLVGAFLLFAFIRGTLFYRSAFGNQPSATPGAILSVAATVADGTQEAAPPRAIVDSPTPTSVQSNTPTVVATNTSSPAPTISTTQPSLPTNTASPMGLLPTSTPNRTQTQAAANAQSTATAAVATAFAVASFTNTPLPSATSTSTSVPTATTTPLPTATLTLTPSLTQTFTRTPTFTPSPLPPTLPSRGTLTYVGIRVEDTAQGVQVQTVSQAALQDGVSVGDVVVAVDFQLIRMSEDFINALSERQAFAIANLRLRRNGRELYVRLELNPTDFAQI